MTHALAIFVSLMFSLSAHAQMSAQVVTPVATPDVPPQLIEAVRTKRLWESTEWLRILHYNKSLFGSYTSQASGMNFFVASHGRSEPQEELEATLAGFFSNEKRTLEEVPAQTVRCQFPLRFMFLNRELGLDRFLPKVQCKEYEEFREKVAAKSATLVFSSFYAGNPSSVYGHSLLRLNKSDGSKGSEGAQLLDYGVNYAANQTTSNPILYTIYGMSGFFKGTFQKIPYFYKVREYGDFESRDLWEYDLSLTPPEVERLVAHLWELGSTYFDYYYLTKNCSYHMLTLIEAAAPRTHLASKVPWWVIPTDSVKAVFEDGLVRKTNFRASLFSQFEARRTKLTSFEEGELRKLVSQDRSRGEPTTLPTDWQLTPEQKARVVDAYMDYVDLQYAKQILKKESRYADPKNALLKVRSRLPMTPALDFSTPPVASPHESHGSARAIVSRIENQNFGGATDFAIRFALHDLADPTRGLPEYSDIDFFHLALRWWDQPQRLRVEHAVLFGVGTYKPLDFYSRKMSWRAKLGLDRVDDRRCSNCLAGGIYGGAGYSTEFGQVLTYALLDGELFTSPNFSESKFSIRAGPVLGTRVRFSPSLALITEASYAWSVLSPTFSSYKVDSRLRLVPGGTSWGLDARAVWRTENREVGLGVLRYF